MINTAAPGPGFLHSFKIGLVIVAATLLSSCLSAPTPTPPSKPWWFEPCTSDVNKRHSRSTNDPLRDVKNQLKIFLAQLKLNMKKIELLYSNNKDSLQTKEKTPNAKLKWLKMKKMLLSIKKSKSQTAQLEQFYNSLQYFAGTLEVLRSVRINTTAVNFDQEERDNIYENITYQMRSLLCEVQENFRNNKQPTDIPKGIPLKRMKIPLKNQMDFTAGHLIDINFFKKTMSFFKRTQKLFAPKVRKVNRKKSAVKKQKRT